MSSGLIEERVLGFGLIALFLEFLMKFRMYWFNGEQRGNRRMVRVLISSRHLE